MSYHLIHILQHNSRLSVDRGCLVCSVPDQEPRRAPLDDILAVIVAARGVAFSAACLPALAERGAVVLHCDSSYRPIAKTVRLYGVIHGEIFRQQLSRDENFNRGLWSKLLAGKLRNQAELLDQVAPGGHKLWWYLDQGGCCDEGNAARHYWKIFFSGFGGLAPAEREHRGAENPINQQLNYGYAVLGAILHRSIVGHGLSPALGVHHCYRFRSDPLVYDLMEPLRSFCDLILYRFYNEKEDVSFQTWARRVAEGLVLGRIKIRGGKSVKLIYAVDRYVAGVARSFSAGVVKGLFIPRTADFDLE